MQNTSKYSSNLQKRLLKAAFFVVTCDKKELKKK